MKINMKVIQNLKFRGVKDKVNDASTKALVTIVTKIANAAIKGSPHITGHNRRSIAYKVGRRITKTGSPKGGEKPFVDWEPDAPAAVYSISGYGGYLETGTSRMPAQPYFKPALDRHIKELPGEIKANLR